MSDPILTPKREMEARRIAALARAASYGDFLHMARVLLSRPDDRPLERGDLQVRECVYRFGARVVEAGFRVWKERPRQPDVTTHPVRENRSPSAGAESLPLPRILPLRPAGHAAKPRGGLPWTTTV
jgi:hypothetical protein